MGNTLVAQLESNLTEACERLDANDPSTTTVCLHWSSPPLEESEHLLRFIKSLRQNRTLTRLIARDLDSLSDYKGLTEAIRNHPQLQTIQFFGRLPQRMDDFVQLFGHSNSILTRVELQSCDVVSSAFANGIQAILRKKAVTSVSIKECRIDGPEMTILTQSLKDAVPALKCLEIELQRSLASPDAIKNISNFLKESDTVQSLSLSGFLQGDSIPVLVDGAKNHVSLTKLKLVGDAINDDTVKVLADSLLKQETTPSSLKILDLSGCAIQGPGGLCLARALSQNTTLQEIYLAHNALGNEGVQAFSRHVLLVDGDAADKIGTSKSEATCSGLSVLDVRLNRIGIQGIKALANALSQNQSKLRVLKIGEEFVIPGRRFEQEDVEALVNMISQNTTLEELCMEDASVQDEFITTLCNSLPQNQSLRRFNIGCFSTLALRSLVDILDRVHLEKLSVRVHGDDVCFDQEIGSMATNKLQQNKKSVNFNVSGLKGDSEVVWKAFRQQLKKGRSLEPGAGNSTEVLIKRQKIDDTQQ